MIQKWESRILLLGFLVLPLALISGCATKFTRGIPAQDLPRDLPRDLQEKFEVHDAQLVSAVSTADQPVVVMPPRVKSKKRGQQGTIVASATKVVFEYPRRRPLVDTAWLNEKHVFDITYFGMSAGDLTMEVMPFKVIGNRKVYHLKGTAVSSSVFSMFYRLNDSLESFMDFDGLFSHRFHLILDESKQVRDALELNDSEKGQTYYWNRWDHKTRGYTETKEFASIAPFSQDSLSALFYIRTLPLPPGAVITIPVVSEGKSWDGVVTVVRRENVSTPLGRNTPCVVLKLDTRYQGVLQKKGDSFLWLTDDAQRFVVKLEAKVRVGTVVVSLKKVERGMASDNASGSHEGQ
jgi:hypothetical protein